MLSCSPLVFVQFVVFCPLSFIVVQVQVCPKVGLLVAILYRYRVGFLRELV